MTHALTKPKADVARVEQKIAELAASFPEVKEENPWGHRAFKVRGKTFLFLFADGGGLSISLKLPVSGAAALSLDFAKPTEYGLGKSGWVTATFASGRDVPVPMVKEWLEESYVAIAPKKLAALRAGTAVTVTTARKTAPTAKAPARAKAPATAKAPAQTKSARRPR